MNVFSKGSLDLTYATYHTYQSQNGNNVSSAYMIQRYY